MSSPPPPLPPKPGRPVSQFAPPPPPPPPPRQAPPSDQLSDAANQQRPQPPTKPVHSPPPPVRPADSPPKPVAAAAEKPSSPVPVPVQADDSIPPPPNAPPPPLPSGPPPPVPVRSNPPSEPVRGFAGDHIGSSVNQSGTDGSTSQTSDIVLEGLLSKRNREGAFDKCYMIVTPTSVRYGKAAGTSKVAVFSDKLTAAVSRAANAATNGSVGTMGNVAAPSPASSANPNAVTLSESATEIAMETILVSELQPGDYDDWQKSGRTFRFRSKHKSFLLRLKSEEEAMEWRQTLQQLSSDIRRKLGKPEPTEVDLAPLWAPNVTANACSLCAAQFTLFLRRHHCRNCGALVCEPCSREKMRIPRLDEKTLFRVCTPCGTLLKDNRSYGAAAPGKFASSSTDL